MGQGRLRRVEQACGGNESRKGSNALAYRKVDPVFPKWQIERANTTGPLSKELWNHVARDVGQPEIATLVMESQFLMVKTKAL